MMTMGTMTTTSSPSVTANSVRLVTASITMPPRNCAALRSPIDIDEPTTVWITVVSAVSRDSTSPVCVCSK